MQRPSRPIGGAMITAQQVAAQLNISRSAAYELMRILGAVKIGRCLRLDRALWTAYLRSLRPSQEAVRKIDRDFRERESLRPAKPYEMDVCQTYETETAFSQQMFTSGTRAVQNESGSKSAQGSKK